MFNIQKFVFVFCLLFFVKTASADFGDCLSMFPNSKPPKVTQPTGEKSKTKELCYSGFAVLYSSESKDPIFSVEKINATQLSGPHVRRTNNFHEEERLDPSERATLDDYRGSSYDRGHMTPAEDQSYSEQNMEDSFSLANMIPQNANLNRGAWAKRVEKPTRQYTMRAKGDVFVFTGPYFSPDHKTIGTNKIWVPTVVWKFVYDSTTERGWGFWIPNTDDARVGPPISYEELVSRTGINFLNK